MDTANPWLLELIVVCEGSHSGTERRAVSRAVADGYLTRIRRGVHVERTAYEAMTDEQRHLVQMRALAAVSPEPPLFSHWSAAVLHGLPVLSSRLTRVHTTVPERRQRGQEDVSAHLFDVVDGERALIGTLLATTAARTVVDIAGGGPFDEGVMAADAALRAGITREALMAASDLAGLRRAQPRIDDVIAFAHPGAESAAESRSRCTMLRLGIEPPELQHLIVIDGQPVWLDFLFRSVRAGGEADGAKKYLDPALAPVGAGRAVYAEKRREDRVRAELNGLARWGWIESGSPSLLQPVLGRAGVHPARPRARLADYADEARSARPRAFLPVGRATRSG